MTRISLNLKHFPFLLVWGVFGVRTQLASFSILTFFFVLPYSLRHDDFQTDLGLHDPNRISVILMRNKSVKRTSVMIMKGKYKQVLSAPLTGEPCSPYFKRKQEAS